jgi:hypothetical protein
MFSCYLFPFILLFSTSSMFEFHVVVAGIVMFNIIELIMKIVSNYRTAVRGELGRLGGRRRRGGGGSRPSRSKG